MYEKKSLADNRRHLSRVSNRGWAVCLSIPLTVRASQSNLAKSTVTNDSISGHLVAECSVVLSFDETVALKPGYARKKSSHCSGAEKAVSTEELEKRATLHSISTINSNAIAKRWRSLSNREYIT
jgi:hypothetical protein